jgi:hypothetical protein
MAATSPLASLRQVVQVRVRLRSWDAWARLAAGALVVSLLVAACTSSSAKTAGPHKTATTSSSTTVASASTTTVAELQTAIVGQWRLAQETLAALQRDPTAGGQNLLLADYVTEPLLSYSRRQFAARARDGLADIGSIDFGAPRVTSVTGSQAIVVSCINDGLALIVKATGKPFPGTNPNPQLEGTTSTMVQSPSGVWKLSDSLKKVGSCEGL